MTSEEEAKETFIHLVTECLRSTELVREFDRLSGTNLLEIQQQSRTPLAAMIDKETGRDAETIHKFSQFVFDTVFIPMLTQAK